MSIVKTFAKAEVERRRLYLNYECWLEETEALADTQITISPYDAIKPIQITTGYVDAEQKKLAVGASTPYNVILTQRDLSTAAGNEVLAQAQYALARIQLDVATGMTLQNNNVEIEEAKEGRVSRPSSTLPVLGNK